LRFGQLAVLTPLAVLLLVLGVAPGLWLPTLEKGVQPPLQTRQAVASQHPIILQRACAAAMYEAPELVATPKLAAKCESNGEAQR
jgi:hypothetical protein